MAMLVLRTIGSIHATVTRRKWTAGQPQIVWVVVEATVFPQAGMVQLEQLHYLPHVQSLANEVTRLGVPCV